MTGTRYPPVKRFRELTRQEQQERMELSADLLPVLQFWRGDPQLNHWEEGFLTPAAEAQAIALSIDGGHVRSVRSYQVRSFEVMLAQAINDDGKQIVFSSMPAEADWQRDQLRGVLHELGATPATLITVLSDGADGPRSLGEAASVGPTHHVLDWFHLSMRIQHVAQADKSWPDTAAEDCKAGTRLSDTIERSAGGSGMDRSDAASSSLEKSWRRLKPWPEQLRRRLRSR